MCFSATASFSAAAICGGVGVVTLRRAPKTGLMLAAIPAVFAAHQTLEGIVWLAGGEGLGRYAGWTFAIVAFCLWPVYIPLAARQAERCAGRRRAMLPFLVLGLVIAAAAASVLSSGLTIDFAAHHIKYLPGRRYPLVFDYLYAMAALGPLFLSRNVYLRLFGGLVLLFFGASVLAFNPARYSIWCFFAAASSILLSCFVESMRQEPRPPESQPY